MAIKHPGLYAETYRFALSVISSSLPLGLLRKGTKVYRVIDGAQRRGRAGADMYRTVYQSSTNDNYRWTGLRDNNGPGAAGLYTALDLDALTGETWQYAFGETVEEDVRSRRIRAGQAQAALQARQIFIYELKNDLKFADLSLTPGSAWAFWDMLDRERSLQPHLARAGYNSARMGASAGDDHSFARAVGHAVHDRYVRLPALCVTSARTDEGTTGFNTGNNIVFFGDDGTMITALEPVQEVLFAVGPTGRLQQTVNKI